MDEDKARLIQTLKNIGIIISYGNISHDTVGTIKEMVIEALVDVGEIERPER